MMSNTLYRQLLSMLMEKNKTRYALFVGLNYYANGGVNDLIKTFATAGDAERYLDEQYTLSDQEGWVHIVDTFDLSIICKCTFDDGVRNDWESK